MSMPMPLDAGGISRATQDARNLVAAVSSHQLVFDSVRGRELINSIEGLRHNLDDVRTELRHMEDPALGSCPDAARVARWDRDAASYAADGPLRDFADALGELSDGIRASMSTYGHSEAGSAHGFTQLQP